jgi:hypothetical protein
VKSNPEYSEFVLHVADDCPECLMAKALLEHYGCRYQVLIEPCNEWQTLPAIYGSNPDGTRELIGGYNDLCSILFEG